MYRLNSRNWVREREKKKRERERLREKESKWTKDRERKCIFFVYFLLYWLLNIFCVSLKIISVVTNVKIRVSNACVKERDWEKGKASEQKIEKESVFSFCVFSFVLTFEYLLCTL